MTVNEFKRKIILPTILAIVVAIVGGFMIGFATGMYYEKLNHIPCRWDKH